MKKILVAAALALSLAACTLEEGIQTACAVKDGAYAAWSNYASTHLVKQHRQDAVLTAYTSATNVCNSPLETRPQITAAALQITNAASAIYFQLRAAEKETKAPLPVSLKRTLEMGSELKMR